MIIKLSSNTYNRLIALLTEHVRDTKHEIAWENSKVITTNNRYGQRLCIEAWHINMSNYALNRDDGAYLPRNTCISLAGNNNKNNNSLFVPY